MPLHVEILQARQIRALDKGKYSDPFCVLKFGRRKMKTTVQKKTLQPEWREEFVFDGSIFEQPTMSLTMFDKDKFTSEFLGQVEISLVSLSDGNEWTDWHELLSKSGARETKSRGEIQVKLQWKGGAQKQNEGNGEENDEAAEENNPFGTLADAVGPLAPCAGEGHLLQT